MARVMFHDICDQCGKHGAEYDAMPRCTECHDSLCDGCAIDTDWEYMAAICATCKDDIRTDWQLEAYMAFEHIFTGRRGA